MSTSTLFKNPATAGEQLAEKILAELTQMRLDGIWSPPLVYALPRGGVRVAVPLARELSCPLRVIVAKKITLPKNPELAIGSVTSEGQTNWMYQPNHQEHKKQILEKARQEAYQKAQEQHQSFADFDTRKDTEGAIAIIVDDGIATGMTMTVAVQAMRNYSPAQIWLCTPVAPRELNKKLESLADRVIILEKPHPFLSVSRFYDQFEQVETEEALADLQKHQQWLEQQ